MLSWGVWELYFCHCGGGEGNPVKICLKKNCWMNQKIKIKCFSNKKQKFIIMVAAAAAAATIKGIINEGGWRGVFDLFGGGGE